MFKKNSEDFIVDTTTLENLRQMLITCTETQSNIELQISDKEQELKRAKGKTVTETSVTDMLDTLVRSADLFPAYQQKKLFEMFF